MKRQLNRKKRICPIELGCIVLYPPLHCKNAKCKANKNGICEKS